MLAGRKWLRKAALALALCASAITASAPAKAEPAWTADPDEQFLLDVQIHQLRLGDGVRACNAPKAHVSSLATF